MFSKHLEIKIDFIEITFLNMVNVKLVGINESEILELY